MAPKPKRKKKKARAFKPQPAKTSAKVEYSQATGKPKEKPRGRKMTSEDARQMAILSHKSKKRKIKHKGYLARCRLYMEDHGWDGMFDLADGYMVIIIPAKKDFKELRTRTPHNDPKMRFDAIRFIASYAHGKPKETLDVSSKGRSFADMARELMRQ